MCEVVVKFAWTFWPNCSDCMAGLDTNVPEMELNMILATSENV